MLRVSPDLRPRRETPALQGQRATWISSSLSIAGFLWFVLWIGISSSPRVLDRIPTTLQGELHYLRALGPLIALGLAALFLLGRGVMAHEESGGLPRVLRPWLLYGVIALLACSTSPNPPHATYWALTYLSAFLVLWLFIQAPDAHERLDRCRHLGYLGWAIAAVVFAILLYVSRDALFVQKAGGLSGYGVTNRVGRVSGVTMVRAAGLARFAAVPVLFAFVLAWRSAGTMRLLWAGVCLGGAAVVYLMQSRGAILGLLGGLAFAMLFMGRRSRLFGVALLLFVTIALATGFEFGVDSGRVMSHLAREETNKHTDITTGRARDWGIAWTLIKTSPFWGWGPQADRYFFRFHVHNTYLYAWLTAGFFGMMLVLIGLIRAWVLLVRALRAQAAERLGQHTTLIQVGCILAFFTIRGIPEVSGAMFGIDLLLMLPAMAWLDALNQTSVEEGLA